MLRRLREMYAKRVRFVYRSIDPLTPEYEVLYDGELIGRIRKVEPFPASIYTRRALRGWKITDPSDVRDITWPSRRHAADALRRLARDGKRDRE